ncbi:MULTISPECIES: DUF2232 domain-containing protein [Limnochorda]|uniref:DUF2232 domain-containing protein n=1 Tax=Limnochorda TaxID=1676651 RepID=UPI001E02F543|nr:DUF2232 domain-containing protein [Limnochorda pilosa]MBO2486053.1 hypothetical protein [Bacillota bacterium]MBO2519033.1 hypothetical protein [Bacillota bacterium]
MSAKPSLEPPHTPLWRVGLLAPALAFLGQFLPLVLFFVPVPIAVVTDLRGWRAGVGWGAAAVAAAVAGVWVLGMDVSRHGAVLASVTLLALLPVAMGLVGGLLYRSDRHQGVTLLAPGGLVIAMVLTAWLSGRWLFQVDLLQAAVEGWRATVEEGLRRAAEVAGGPPGQLENWEALVESMAQGIQLLFPAGLVVTTGLWSVGVQWLTGRWLQALGRPLRPGKPFIRWRFPWVLAWGYILGQLLLMGTRSGRLADPEGRLAAIGVNLVLIFTYVFFVEGLAVLWFYLAKWGVGKGGRLLITVLLLTPFLPLMEPVAWLGMLDAWLDFRKLQREGGS